MERFFVACPVPKRLLPEDVTEANDQLNEMHHDLHDMKELFRIIHSYHNHQRLYSLSPEAMIVYKKLVTEHAEAFNAMIEQRMHGSAHEEQSSKCIRMFIKLAGILHVLENTFRCLNSGQLVEIPECISKETAVHAQQLSDYCQQQKEVLFKDSQEEDTHDGLEQTIALKRRILLHPGKFVTVRSVAKSISTRNRAEAQKSLPKAIDDLVNDGLGVILEDTKSKCFLKKDLKDDQLLKFEITSHQFTEACSKEDKFLSSRQKEQFRGLATQLN